MKTDPISHYEFGRITIEGKTYEADVIIYPGHVDDTWWRREGHEFCPDDLKQILKAELELLIVGTGYFGRMRILPETLKVLSERKIRLLAGRTKEACDQYNQLYKSSQRVVAALHLTC